MSLKDRHPSLYTELKVNGNFMGRKTGHRFSSIPIDQCTEQEVCWLKNEGGVIGNLDNEQTVRRHQAPIPEIIRMVKKFEKTLPLLQTMIVITRCIRNFKRISRIMCWLLLTHLKSLAILGKRKVDYCMNWTNPSSCQTRWWQVFAS